MRTAAQAYLNTRVSAMAIRLFDPDTIGRLTRMELPELAEHFGFAPLLDGQPSTKGRSRAIEQSLVQVLLAELQVLVRPMNAAERGIVFAWARKYALFNLKTLIRGKLHALDQREIRDSLFDLPAAIRLPDEEMLQAEDVPELLRQLEAGQLRPIARQAREIYEQRHEPFALEAAIDQRYYLGLVRQLMHFHDDSLTPLQHLIGAELDRVALLWLLRFRFSYRLSPSETFYQLVPSMRHLYRERLLALVNIETLDGVLEALPPPFDALSNRCQTVLQVQQCLGRYVAHEARRILRQSQSGVARALAFLMLRELDLFLLFALIQGQILNLSPEVKNIALEMTKTPCPWPSGRDRGQSTPETGT
jgi:V/A-type H+-transporting ATPase subunit C